MKPILTLGAAVLALSLCLVAPRPCAADSFTFTNLPVPFSYSNFGLLYAGASNVDVLRFEMDVTGAAKSTALMWMHFNFDGFVPARALTNFRIVYYPNGVRHDGIVIGADSGATFDGTSIGLFAWSPFPLGRNFKGIFALRLDIPPIFTTSFFFTPQLDDVTITADGIFPPVVSSTLPLTGDVFHIEQD
jgi:hypothetical protein